jgi:hypothetical protein
MLWPLFHEAREFDFPYVLNLPLPVPAPSSVLSLSHEQADRLLDCIYTSRIYVCIAVMAHYRVLYIASIDFNAPFSASNFPFNIFSSQVLIVIAFWLY